jgi:hypothetical protein
MHDKTPRFFPGVLLGFFNWPFHLLFHLMVDEATHRPEISGARKTNGYSRMGVVKQQT